MTDLREAIARAIESHDAFECRNGWTYPKAAEAIADAILSLSPIARAGEAERVIQAAQMWFDSLSDDGWDEQSIREGLRPGVAELYDAVKSTRALPIKEA